MRRGVAVSRLRGGRRAHCVCAPKGQPRLFDSRQSATPPRNTGPSSSSRRKAIEAGQMRRHPLAVTAGRHSTQQQYRCTAPFLGTARPRRVEGAPRQRALACDSIHAAYLSTNGSPTCHDALRNTVSKGCIVMPSYVPCREGCTLLLHRQCRRSRQSTCRGGDGSMRPRSMRRRRLKHPKLAGVGSGSKIRCVPAGAAAEADAPVRPQQDPAAHCFRAGIPHWR